VWRAFGTVGEQFLVISLSPRKQGYVKTSKRKMSARFEKTLEFYRIDPKERLTSVLNAGIHQRIIATHPPGASPNDSKRANAASDLLNLMQLDDDLLLKIFDMAVRDDNPCEAVETLCRVNKGVCANERLYDEINKKFRWYGPYGTLDKLNKNKRVAWVNKMPVQLKASQQIGAQADWTAKQWFDFSCYILRNNEHKYVYALVDVTEQNIESRPELLDVHPALYILQYQQLTKGIMIRLKKLNKKLRNLDDDDLDEEMRILKSFIEKTVVKLEALVNLFRYNQPNDKDTEAIFNDIVKEVWDPSTKFFFEHQALEDDLAFYALLRNFLIMLTQMTFLRSKYEFIQSDSTDNYFDMYGYFRKINNVAL
jgi:hypothetical protein